MKTADIQVYVIIALSVYKKIIHWDIWNIFVQYLVALHAPIVKTLNTTITKGASAMHRKCCSYNDDVRCR